MNISKEDVLVHYFCTCFTVRLDFQRTIKFKSHTAVNRIIVNVIDIAHCNTLSILGCKL